MGYEIGKKVWLWDFTEIWLIPANQVSGCQKSWVIIGYGLSERWVMTESTVLPCHLPLFHSKVA